MIDREIGCWLPEAEGQENWEMLLKGTNLQLKGK